MSRTANIPTRRLAQERRRTEAEARQKAYDALPQAEKDARNPKKAKVDASTPPRGRDPLTGAWTDQEDDE